MFVSIDTNGVFGLRTLPFLVTKWGDRAIPDEGWTDSSHAGTLGHNHDLKANTGEVSPV